MATPRGVFITIEGTDSSGKSSQSRMLTSWLEGMGQRVRRLEFPAYDTPWGATVARYLRGEFGTLREVPPEIPALLYAGDRYQFKADIETSLSSGVHVVSDRYTGSNLGYQGAKYAGEDRRAFIRWIEEVESRLPPPDIVIFLRMPLDVAQKLIEGRGQKGAVDGGGRDIHELDMEYLRRVEEVYEGLIGERENWNVVECSRDGEPRDPAEIHAEVKGLVGRVLQA